MKPQQGRRREGDNALRISSAYSIVALVIVAVALLAAASAFHLPRVETVSAAANHFSAERAAQVLRYVLGDGGPHPMGTPANAAVRDRIISVLRSQVIFERSTF